MKHLITLSVLLFILGCINQKNHQWRDDLDVVRYFDDSTFTVTKDDIFIAQIILNKDQLPYKYFTPAVSVDTSLTIYPEWAETQGMKYPMVSTTTDSTFIFKATEWAPYQSNIEIADSSNKQQGKIVTHYETFGEGPPLLLINGGPGYNSEGFRPIAQQLADTLERRVIIYDQRGTGQSKLDTISVETVTMELMVQDIEYLRKRLNIDKWTVMGHSFGGTLAANYAAEYPEKIDKLILSSSGGMDLSTLNSEGTMARLTDVQIDSMNYWTSKLMDGDTSFHTQYQWALSLAPAFVNNKKYIPAIAKRLTQGNRQVSGLVIRDMQETNFDLKGPLRKFRKPVLIIQGEDDIIKKTTAEQTHSLFPNSKLIILEGSGHYGWLDRPEEFFKKIEKFLANDTITE